MKKIAILFFVLVAMIGNSQNTDTLFLGAPREATFYYWDDNWIDQFLDLGVGFSKMGTVDWMQQARHIDVKDSIRIIGLAAPVIIYSEENFVCDTMMSHRKPEYLQLWEPQGDSMILVASGRWDTCTPRYRLHLFEPGLPPDPPHFDGIPDTNAYPEIMEVYFDTVYTMHDSFYMATTSYNNYDSLNANGYCLGRAHPSTGYLMAYVQYGQACHRPNYSKWRYTRFGYPVASTADTNWHIQFQTCESWHCFFPIFDTTNTNGYPPQDTLSPYDPGNGYSPWCDTVTGLYRMATEGTEVALAWNADGHSQWNVSCVPLSVVADEGAIRTTTSPFILLDNLIPNTWYAAYVRTQCDDTAFSAWSRPLLFYNAGSEEPIGVDNINDEAFTMVYPNPANTETFIYSSYHIRELEVFSSDGRRVEHRKVHANGVTLDLRGYAQGTYWIRIHTAYGDVTRRLVVINR